MPSRVLEAPDYSFRNAPSPPLLPKRYVDGLPIPQNQSLQNIMQQPTFQC